MNLLMLIFLLFPLAAGAQIAAGSGHSFHPIIEFGHEGGNLRPYRIGIDAAGHIKVMKGNPQLKAQSIPAEQVQELLQKATDNSFWKGVPGSETPASALPDFGFVFVTVHSTKGKVTKHHGAQSGPLGEFYSTLSDLVLAKP